MVGGCKGTRSQEAGPLQQEAGTRGGSVGLCGCAFAQRVQGRLWGGGGRWIGAQSHVGRDVAAPGARGFLGTEGGSMGRVGLGDGSPGLSAD